MGLLSHSISVQKPQESIPLILEKKRGEDRNREEEKEMAPGSGLGVSSVFQRAEGEGERGGVFMVPTQGSKIPSDLN